MTKRSKIYTKAGDTGMTGLVGGTRVKKHHGRLEAYGTIDELNAAIGVIRSYEMPVSLSEMLIKIQNTLFNIGARLASDEKADVITGRLVLTKKSVEFLEESIDKLEEDLPLLKHFILPGGDPASAYCHVARTICRRAERKVVKLTESFNIEPEIVQYINRLSDLLFTLARKFSLLNGNVERIWQQE